MNGIDSNSINIMNKDGNSLMQGN